MSTTAVTTTGITLAIGICMGAMMGASWKRSTVFAVANIGVCLALHHSPVFATLPLIKLLAENIIGCLAGYAVSRGLLGQDHVQEKEKFGLPEAVGTHILTLFGTVWFIAMFVPSLVPEHQPVSNS